MDLYAEVKNFSLMRSGWWISRRGKNICPLSGICPGVCGGAGLRTKIYTTLDRKEALPDADFVITQFRVGRLYARIKDERIPLLHGMLGQETNGAGGIFKALRTIPVIRESSGIWRDLS